MAELRSQKLTENFRDRLRGKLLRHRFSAEEAALDEREKKHADAVYRDIYGADLKKMAALPDGWLPTDPAIGARFGTAYQRVSFGESRRVFARHENACARAYDATHALSVEYEAIQGDKAELRERRRAAERQIAATLSNFGTTKQLLEAWPEIESFVREVIGAPVKTALPAIPVAQLNALLALPPEEQADAA